MNQTRTPLDNLKICRRLASFLYDTKDAYLQNKYMEQIYFKIPEFVNKIIKNCNRNILFDSPVLDYDNIIILLSDSKNPNINKNFDTLNNFLNEYGY